MKYLFSLLLVISFSNKSKAADTLITKFINSVYKQVIDSGENQYDLFQYGSSPKAFGRQPIDLNPKKIFGISKTRKDIPFNDFMQILEKDTSRINWSDYALKNVKIIDRDHILCNFLSVKDVNSDTSKFVKSTYNKRCEVIVYIKNGMSKKEIDSAEDKAIDEYNKQPGMVKYPYFFSRPLFSKNCKYALLSVDTPVGGSIYVFKFIKGNWLKILEFGFYDV